MLNCFNDYPYFAEVINNVGVGFACEWSGVSDQEFEIDDLQCSLKL